MADQRSITGSRLLCYVNSRLLGTVVGFSWDSVTDKKVIQTLDISIPTEIASTTGMARGTITLIRTIGDGGAQSAGMAAPFQTDLSREKYFTIALVERSTDTTVFKGDACSLEGESWSVDPRGFLVGVVRFLSLTWVNDSAV